MKLISSVSIAFAILYFAGCGSDEPADRSSVPDANGGLTTVPPRDGGALQDAGSATLIWPTPSLPTPVGEPIPLTCAFLEGQNCFKKAIATAIDCLGKVPLTGKQDETLAVCNASNGNAWDIAGGISGVQSSGVTYLIRNNRLRNAAGAACFLTTVRGPFSFSITGAEGTVYVQPDDAVSGRIICPDGVQHKWGVAGACPGFGAGVAAGTTPSLASPCINGSCELRVGGGPSPNLTLAKCELDQRALSASASADARQ